MSYRKTIPGGVPVFPIPESTLLLTHGVHHGLKRFKIVLLTNAVSDLF